MTTYRKKRAEITAWKWDGTDDRGHTQDIVAGVKVLVLYTAAGMEYARLGDYIVNDAGLEYPVCARIFHHTYEEVGEVPHA
jgi:hypothetical protein